MTIDELLAAYGERMDAADWDGVGALFADGALAAPDGTELAHGSAGVATFYRDNTQLHDGSPRTRHLTLGTETEMDGESALARSVFLVLQDLDGTVRPIAAGRYVDRLRKGSDGWAFAERRFFLDATGDLSRHLIRPPS